MDFKCDYVILICILGDQYTVTHNKNNPVLSYTAVYYTGGGVQCGLTTGPGLPVGHISTGYPDRPIIGGQPN
eukprot:7553981-Ditylum_brightwellii.AAC.1